MTSMFSVEVVGYKMTSGKTTAVEVVVVVAVAVVRVL